jgi:expansin (peptidoglycan-binding protein)
MKSTIFSILPIAGLAVAESVCTRQTVTKTAYETVYETANAADITSGSATGKSATCSSRSTVTTTSYEKVYVTVTPGAAEASPYPTMSVLPTTQVDYSSLAYSAVPQSEAVKSYEAAVSSGAAAVSSSVAAVSSSAAAVSSGAAAVSTSQYETPSASPSASAAQAAYPTDTTSSNSKSGEATFYGGNLSGGMCSFTGYTIPSGLFGTALSDSNWDTAGNCGACVSVTGPSGNKVTAMIVDQCPGCGTNHLDLFPDAFAELAEPSTGEISTTWDIVPCGITTPIVLKNKEGTSSHWFSMQVMNSNVAVSKLEVSTDNGSTWQATTRQEYNYFENSSGFGTESVDVKVTSTSGGSIVVKGVSVAASSTKTAGSNFDA